MRSLLRVFSILCSYSVLFGKNDVDEYDRIKKLADEVIYTSEENKKGCMHKRNRYLVDNSSLCICYITRKSGGTAYTVKYAQNNGMTVVNVKK